MRLRGIRRLPEAARLGCLAAAEALASAGGIVASEAAGVLVGTNRAAEGPIADFVADAKSAGIRLVNPALFPDTVMNAVAGHIAIRFGLKGPTATFSAAEQVDFDAFESALDLLRTGRLIQAVVCGVEAEQGCGTVVLQCRDSAPRRPLAALEVLRRIPVPQDPWSALEAWGITDADDIICPGGSRPLRGAHCREDPLVLAGSSGAAAGVFAVIAGVRALTGERRRIWVVERGKRMLTALLLRTCDGVGPHEYA